MSHFTVSLTSDKLHLCRSVVPFRTVVEGISALLGLRTSTRTVAPSLAGASGSSYRHHLQGTEDFACKDRCTLEIWLHRKRRRSRAGKGREGGGSREHPKGVSTFLLPGQNLGIEAMVHLARGSPCPASSQGSSGTNSTLLVSYSTVHYTLKASGQGALPVGAWGQTICLSGLCHPTESSSV